MKKNKIFGIIVAIFVLAQLPTFADSAWNDLIDASNSASEGSTVSILNDITADGTSAGFLQKQLTIDFNGKIINGITYSDDSPIVFSASGSSETRLQIMNATFQGFDTENGIALSFGFRWALGKKS